MNLNVDKCKILSIKGRNENKFNYTISKDNNSFTLEHVDHIKDLGVIIDRDLSFDLHISEKVNIAFQMLGIINRNFADIDENTFLLLYKAMVRSHLEFAGSVWNLNKIYFIKIRSLEKIQ